MNGEEVKSYRSRRMTVGYDVVGETQKDYFEDLYNVAED